MHKWVQLLKAAVTPGESEEQRVNRNNVAWGISNRTRLWPPGGETSVWFIFVSIPIPLYTKLALHLGSPTVLNEDMRCLVQCGFARVWEAVFKYLRALTWRARCRPCRPRLGQEDWVGSRDFLSTHKGTGCWAEQRAPSPTGRGSRGCGDHWPPLGFWGGRPYSVWEVKPSGFSGPIQQDWALGESILEQQKEQRCGVPRKILEYHFGTPLSVFLVRCPLTASLGFLHSLDTWKQQKHTAAFFYLIFRKFS